MKKVSTFLVICFAVMSFILAVPVDAAQSGFEVMPVKTPGKTLALNNLGHIPLYFITNQGQVNDKVAFYARASRYNLWVTRQGLVFDSQKRAEGRSIQRDVSKLEFVNANANPEISALDTTSHRISYFRGNDRSKWRTNVPTSAAILYKNVYNKIDLKVYGIEKEVEYDWVVNAHGNPEDIRFQYKNVKDTSIDADGNLLIETRFGTMRHNRPVSFQEINGERVPVRVEFKRIKENVYGFAVETYDSSRRLVIDPVVLVYSTYLGGTGADNFNGFTGGPDGKVYITGSTTSADFPCKNALDNTFAGENNDVFVSVIDTDALGQYSLVFSTYIGGAEPDSGARIAVDQSGNIYVVGNSKPQAGGETFPIVNGEGPIGDYDAFVVKIGYDSLSGLYDLAFSSMFGGEQSDFGRDIAIGNSGQVIITGVTSSSDWVTRYDDKFDAENAYEDEMTGTHALFVMELTIGGTDYDITYNTLLGDDYGVEGDYSYVAAGNDGRIYVGGSVHFDTIPLVGTTIIDESFGGGREGFVSIFDPSVAGPSSLVYSSYFGGDGNDTIRDIEVALNGDIYIVGYTDSDYVANDEGSFPVTTASAYQSSRNGSTDAFVAKLSPDGSDFDNVYTSYLGGGSSEQAASIKVDGNRYIYVGGKTGSSDFPLVDQIDGCDSAMNAFFCILDTATPDQLGLIFSTGLGGTGKEGNAYIGVIDPYHVTVSGMTESNDLWVVNPEEDELPFVNPYQTDFNGSSEAFVCQLDLSDVLDITDITVTSPNGGESLRLGNIKTITWDAAGLSGDVKITLYKDDVFLGLVASGLDPSAGSYDWTIGEYSGGMAAAGTGYKIKIKEFGTIVSDMSDAAFTLYSLEITSPNGGEYLWSGSSRTITWNGQHAPGTVKITLYKDGSSVKAITNSVTASAGSYTWTVGQLTVGTASAGTGYKIKIRSNEGWGNDYSDAAFTIYNLDVTSPNGGEQWTLGTSRTITWNGQYAPGTVKITLYQNDVLVKAITNSVTTSTGSYTWTVGQLTVGTASAGTGYKIKIRSNDGYGNDSSDQTFTLIE